MTAVYFYLVLVNAAVSFAVAWIVYWKNRFQATGPLIGLVMAINGLWLVGFAQYYRAMPNGPALFWGKLTLSASIIDQAFLFHGLCALVGRMRRYRWHIAAFYFAGGVFVLLVCFGQMVTGLRFPPYMHHYVHYNRTFYPYLASYYVLCQWIGAGIVAYNAYHSVGYRRTQLVYFCADGSFHSSPPTRSFSHSNTISIFHRCVSLSCPSIWRCWPGYWPAPVSPTTTLSSHACFCTR